MLKKIHFSVHWYQILCVKFSYFYQIYHVKDVSSNINLYMMKMKDKNKKWDGENNKNK